MSARFLPIFVAMTDPIDKEKRCFRNGGRILLAFASQTGTAKALATRIYEHNPSMCDLVNLAEIAPETLEQYGRHIFIVSTFGEGEAPTEVRPFTQALDQSSINLDQVKFAVLALGNRQYADFCGFGKHLTQQLLRQGADPRVPTTELHCNDAAVFSHWWQKLSETFGIALEPDMSDWEVATVMDTEEQTESALDLVFYIQCLEHEQATALRFKPKRKNPNLEPFVAEINPDPSNPFTRIRITTDHTKVDKSGTAKLLLSAKPGDKWHVQVTGSKNGD
jgi:sulfite reductase alpha subunit-like flavoprotein